MSEKPILFSAPMVRAILSGAKTMTRRCITKQPDATHNNKYPYWNIGGYRTSKTALNPLPCPYGAVGTKLWVRETTTYWEHPESCEDYIVYNADGFKQSISKWEHPHAVYDHCVGRFGKNLPSIFMPRWASRITLEVTDVRVERLQDITEEDAKAEGAEKGREEWYDGVPCTEYIAGFRDLWQKLNQKRGYGWDTNPWLWVLTFKRV